MIFKNIITFIPSLLYAVVVLGLFYWQFNTLYSLIITHFTEAKLSTLYGYLFVYLFGVLLLSTTLINLLYRFVITQRTFVAITLGTLSIFYGLSFREFYHIIEYFVQYPMSTNTILGMVFFMLLVVGEVFYSLGLLLFRAYMPLSHMLLFLILGGGYALYFIHHYASPLV